MSLWGNFVDFFMFYGSKVMVWVLEVVFDDLEVDLGSESGAGMC